MEPIQVKVEQKHIDRGKVSDCCCCPIALALKDLGCHDVQVGDEEIYFNIDGRQYFSGTGKSAYDFINDFDAGINVAPFEFTLFPAIDK